MNNILSSVKNKFIPISIAVIITLLTVSTSAMAMLKVSKSLTFQKPETPQIQETATLIAETSTPEPVKTFGTSSTKKAAASPTPTPSVKPGTPISTPTPTPRPVTASVSNSASITASSKCVITLFGKQYDVTTLATTHSGGNVFNCGTDMTATYQNQHGTNLSRMQPYLITSSGTTQSSTRAGNTNQTGATATPTPQVNTGGQNVEDEDDDYEDRGEENYENEHEYEIDRDEIEDD